MRALLPCLLLAATPVLAEPDARSLLIKAARDNGCLLTDATARAAVLPFGVSEAALLAAVQAMRDAGEADAKTGAMRLDPAFCDGVTPATVPSVTPQMARLIAVFQANGCRLEDASARSTLAAAGIDDEDIARVGPESLALGDLGLMRRDEATRSVIVSEPLCSAPVVAADPTEPLLRLLQENDCAVSFDDAQRLAPGYGLTMEQVEAMSAYLIDRGIAAIFGGRWLTLPECPD